LIEGELHAVEIGARQRILDGENIHTVAVEFVDLCHRLHRVPAAESREVMNHHGLERPGRRRTERAVTGVPTEGANDGCGLPHSTVWRFDSGGPSEVIGQPFSRRLCRVAIFS
jgi:hypothetical protein